MTKYLTQLILWWVATVVYVGILRFYSDENRMLELAYFLVAAFPPIVSYRRSAERYIDALIAKNLLDGSRFDIRVLGAIAPYFIAKLFSKSSQMVAEKIFVRTQLILTVTLFISSIAVMNYFSFV